MITEAWCDKVAAILLLGCPGQEGGHAFADVLLGKVSHYGFKCSLNPTFPARKTNGWISSGYYGLDQGTVVLMIENQRSELLWRLMRHCPSVGRGLGRAGFAGGWVGAAVPVHEGSSVSGAGRRTRTPRPAMPRDLRGR